jgi:hypothetical protein
LCAQGHTRSPIFKRRSSTRCRRSQHLRVEGSISTQDKASLAYNTTEPSHSPEVGTFHPPGVGTTPPKGVLSLTLNHKPLNSNRKLVYNHEQSTITGPTPVHTRPITGPSPAITGPSPARHRPITGHHRPTTGQSRWRPSPAHHRPITGHHRPITDPSPAHHRPITGLSRWRPSPAHHRPITGHHRPITGPSPAITGPSPAHHRRGPAHNRSITGPHQPNTGSSLNIRPTAVPSMSHHGIRSIPTHNGHWSITGLPPGIRP